MSYLEQGLEQLHELGRPSAGVVTAARQRALESYCRRVAMEMESYVERVRSAALIDGACADCG